MSRLVLPTCPLQVDIEMSFVDQAAIMSLVEGLIGHSWPEETGSISTPFPTVTYADAMRDYGVDKPDTRFDMKVGDRVIPHLETLVSTAPHHDHCM